jgi:hypothetical protein
MGTKSSGRMTQFSNSKVAMMLLVAATMVRDHFHGCITTDIGNVTTRPKSVMNQIES